MVPLLEKNRAAVTNLCRQFGLRKLELFGSACTSEFDPKRSDLDFLVEFPIGYDFGPWLAKLNEFEEALADLLGHPVDLVMPSALRNPWFRREANKARVLLYDASKDSQMVAGYH